MAGTHCGLTLAWLSMLLLLSGCGGGSSSTANTPPGGGGTPPPGSGSANVLTYHDDNARDGLNAQETALTLANVNSSSFGKIGFFAMDGKVDAQTLYVSALNIGGAMHNVVFAASEHDSVYAFDADTGAVRWQVSLLGSGETPSDDRGCDQVSPEIGVTATPVIDPKAGTHGTIYIVAMSKDANGNYFQRLHALDLTTGAEMAGSPVTVQGKYPGTGDNSSNGYVIFDPAQYKERPGLLLLNGVVYTFWSSHCDFTPYTGWIIGYNENSLAQTSVLNVIPNGSGGSIWASGAGPAADSSGNIFFLDANGTFETTLDANGFPISHDYGNAFIKLSTAGGTLAVSDYFNMAGTLTESSTDEDLGSGDALLLPDVKDASGTLRHLAVGAGKDQTIYVVNRDNMGKFHPNGDQIWQGIPNGLGGGEFGMPAYFNGTVYYGAVGDSIRAFPVSNALLATSPSSQTANSFVYPGATPGISANGSANGIVWAVENSNPAVLYAYDAGNLAHELYDSNQAGTRDQFGPGNKFITPTIANGKVYVGTTNGVAVFGLLH
ncbi:MAG: PQQ-binding-like beta-propeller repeat protein [Gammaproteobacteria bacterium]|nr:PQQ-binding-like beta-propeller repeat protein [Gammaproteobacteria bacterium]MBU6509125.1 PQQ-binding-like beta-propeller repeat protein [Gammaproteobacteria bacterium]MDE2460372.1 PQQ-binding-like beta-propeller repeat protein [Gammaproteobacteria bacterium]